ncbi:hypothetical protein [Streptomyces sp. NPDC010273]|uniref:hypothetical protein n=1 Tax=Streptomyces sp. NPDC010273 TaxID=3364829 RepID=UPI0036F15B15
MADTGFNGDPYHEGGNQPMASEKGGMEMPNTQQPMQGQNAGSTDGNTVTPYITGWDKSSLAPKVTPTGNNDKSEAH